MADGGPSAAEDATTTATSELGDGDSRVTRERHKRADAATPIATTSSSAKRGHEADASVDDHHPRVHHRHQHHSPRHSSYHHTSPPSHYHHNHFNPHRQHLTNHRGNDGDRRSSNNHISGGSTGGGGGAPATSGAASSSCVDATGTAGSDDEEESGSGGGIGDVGKPCGGVGVDDSGSGGGGDDGSGSGSGGVDPYHHHRDDDIGIEIIRGSVVSEDDDDDEDDDVDDEDDDYYGGSGGVDSDCDGDSGGSSSSISSSKSGAGGVAVIMTGGNNKNNNNNATTRVGVGVEDADGAADDSNADGGAPEVNDREDRDGGRRRGASVAVVASREAKPMADKEETRANGEDAVATAKKDNVAARHQGSPFKGQVRMAEDTLVGPCGKKRCADRYDSSESSDSGVAVSCGECSSSGTSDITEPGSPCSTSSDEGIAAIRGTSASSLLPTLLKLAPPSQIGTRPQWPWTPPLAATACSTTAYKRLRGEPEAGALPRSGAADPTSRGAVKANGKTSQHHHESQGKITEYFKTQIKPQQPKVKKTSEMSVLVAKSTSEFRRPPTVQRNKGGLAKYLGNSMSNSNRVSSANDWEVRTLTSPSSAAKKPPLVIAPRANSKIDKKLPKPLPSLPISNDVLKNLPKISPLRLTSDASINATKCSSPPATVASLNETKPLDFKGCILSKPHVNENNNLTNSCGGILGALRSQGGRDSPISRLSSPSKEDRKDEDAQPTPVDEDDVDEEDSRSSESKPSLSPILSAPTTIRFPARAPEKDRPQATDSGICRWDKCEASFESVGGLLEHLQVHL